MRGTLNVALVLLWVRLGNTDDGFCSDGKCFSVHAHRVGFDAAGHACKDRGGHLMTVRTERTQTALTDLLRSAGHFWLGLASTDPRCSDSSGGLKGYKWTTGDDSTQYTNWNHRDPVCFSRCVSVSKSAPKWTERSCLDIIEGYLCEYQNQDPCQPLGTNATYETPLGFTSDRLEEVPSGSNATARPLGTRHVCLSGSWFRAPWSCEVFGGGCEHACVRVSQGHECSCPDGFKVDANGITCSPRDDPCVRAGCAHDCRTSAGSAVCACDPGFLLGHDGRSCEDVNECMDANACPGRNRACVNTAGGFRCECEPGFESSDGVCVDVDECALVLCEHHCSNTEGSYQCFCFDGFRQSAEDRDKCEMFCVDFECPAECDPNNEAQCDCPDGFVLEDQLCVDIDECDSGSCEQGCENTPGGFACSCHEGFRLVDHWRCSPDDLEGSGTSDPPDAMIPTSGPPPVQGGSLSSGGLLGILVCSGICLLVLVCLAHCVRRKMHQYDVHKGPGEMFAFQQVIVDRNIQLAYPNRYVRRET